MAIDIIQSAPVRADGNDVLTNPNYALHVLGSLTYALSKLPQKATDLVGNKYDYAKWAEDHKDLLATARKLNKQLHGLV